MSMCRLFYVSCDGCGDPFGGADGMQDTVKEAREYAKTIFGMRTIQNRGGKRRDLCIDCYAKGS